MNVDEIITFLKTVELNSITAAANTLYISQSSASTRISRLENFLGYRLFYREQGHRTVSLTKEGEYFLPIAQQWLALYNDARNISNSELTETYRVTSNIILNHYLLPAVFSSFQKHYSGIMICSQTEHSTEAHQSVANQLTDLAIEYTEHNQPNIISKPFFREDMVYICHKDSIFARTHNTDDLIDKNEVYASWSDEFDKWHNRKFPYFQRSKIIIGGAFMFEDFLEDINDWAIVSKIVAEHIRKTNPSFTEIPSSDLPCRTAYLISHKYPKPGIKHLNMLFENELYHILKDISDIHLLIHQ